jgi:hypothetical protein
MNKIHLGKEIRIINVMPARGERIRDWQRWSPYAAVTWSLIYAALGIYWAVSGCGFPFAPESASDSLGPLVGRFGPVIAWIVVILPGLPAAALGITMLRGVRGRLLRPLFITFGALLAVILLLMMTSLNLLVQFGYIPYTVYSLFKGNELAHSLLEAWIQCTTIYQLLCLLGGFLWLIATVTYTRRSVDACLYCGRRDGPEGWTSPINAARWGRTAVYLSSVVPLFYAFTRYAWALGFPLGMTEEYLRQGQESGTWISGLFLANFGLVGAILMFGLVQRWGEVFPRWMIGLSGRRVPIALAAFPASLVSVLLIVGGIGIWSGLHQMTINLVASGVTGSGIFWGILFQVGPTLLFPIWGLALAVATLGYCYRRRGPCRVCGRGASGVIGA